MSSKVMLHANLCFLGDENHFGNSVLAFVLPERSRRMTLRNRQIFRRLFSVVSFKSRRYCGTCLLFAACFEVWESQNLILIVWNLCSLPHVWWYGGVKSYSDIMESAAGSLFARVFWVHGLWWYLLGHFAVKEECCVVGNCLAMVSMMEQLRLGGECLVGLFDGKHMFDFKVECLDCKVQ